VQSADILNNKSSLSFPLPNQICGSIVFHHPHNPFLSPFSLTDQHHWQY
jgi:hypothetical protein